MSEEMLAESELERKVAIAPILALLKSYEHRVKRDDLLIMEIINKRLQSWVFGKGKLDKVSSARPSYVSERTRVDTSYREWEKDSREPKDKGYLPMYRLAYSQCLDSLCAMACTGSYEDLVEAVNVLDDLPSSPEEHEEALIARAQGKEPEFPPTLSELYDQTGRFREAPDPAPKTAQEKVLQLTKNKKAANA